MTEEKKRPTRPPVRRVPEAGDPEDLIYNEETGQYERKEARELRKALKEFKEAVSIELTRLWRILRCCLVLAFARLGKKFLRVAEWLLEGTEDEDIIIGSHNRTIADEEWSDEEWEEAHERWKKEAGMPCPDCGDSHPKSQYCGPNKVRPVKALDPKHDQEDPC